MEGAWAQGGLKYYFQMCYFISRKVEGMRKKLGDIRGKLELKKNDIKIKFLL